MFKLKKKDIFWEANRERVPSAKMLSGKVFFYELTWEILKMALDGDILKNREVFLGQNGLTRLFKHIYA